MAAGPAGSRVPPHDARPGGRPFGRGAARRGRDHRAGGAGGALGRPVREPRGRARDVRAVRAHAGRRAGAPRRARAHGGLPPLRQGARPGAHPQAALQVHEPVPGREGAVRAAHDAGQRVDPGVDRLLVDGGLPAEAAAGVRARAAVLARLRQLAGVRGRAARPRAGADRDLAVLRPRPLRPGARRDGPGFRPAPLCRVPFGHACYPHTVP